MPRLVSSEASYSLVKSLRASFWALGPLLARGGTARVAMPGGDVIGARPVDIHLDALQQMGAEIKVKGGVVAASATGGLRPADIEFRFASVGATHQVLMAASLTPGTTTISNAAREPEVVALAKALTEMGAKIEGAGEGQIAITGAEKLNGFSQAIIGDRIEAATFLYGALATNGEVTVKGFNPDHLVDCVPVLRELGAEVTVHENGISLVSKGLIRPVKVTTGPFPEFASDIQALLMSVLCLADGESEICETVYEGRFGHVSELCRMGAKIRLDGHRAIITGIKKFQGATVEVRDLRAGAAIVIAGLAAEGRTVIEEGHHLRRGYEKLEAKFKSLGGNISDTQDESSDFHLLGC